MSVEMMQKKSVNLKLETIFYWQRKEFERKKRVMFFPELLVLGIVLVLNFYVTEI
jgi:hypothetical protein